MLGNDAGHDRPQRSAHAHAIFIRLIRRVLQKVLPGERVAKPLPLAVAGQADKNLRAIGGGAPLIYSPTAPPPPPPAPPPPPTHPPRPRIPPHPTPPPT